MLVFADDESGLRPIGAFQNPVVVRVLFDDAEPCGGNHTVRELSQLATRIVQHIPRPLELVAQHTHGFVQNGVGNVADVDAGINGGADHLARCSFRDSAIRRSMSASVFIPSAFARSRPYPMSPSRERSSKYCLTASSSSSAGSLLWARAASSNCFANSPESGRWLSTWRLRYYCRTSANRLYHRSLGEM